MSNLGRTAATDCTNLGSCEDIPSTSDLLPAPRDGERSGDNERWRDVTEDTFHDRSLRHRVRYTRGKWTERHSCAGGGKLPQNTGCRRITLCQTVTYGCSFL
jgi:hypothetical protein